MATRKFVTKMITVEELILKAVKINIDNIHTEIIWIKQNITVLLWFAIIEYKIICY